MPFCTGVFHRGREVCAHVGGCVCLQQPLLISGPAPATEVPEGGVSAHTSPEICTCVT